ncbi:MAG: hypothetical protein KIS91_02400 [Anaerolineae bacterium]|nr:hypothetical protein [Anaerolineae bacterium]
MTLSDYPTLLTIGRDDAPALHRNEAPRTQLTTHAGYLLEEPRAPEEVAQLTEGWFLQDRTP